MIRPSILVLALLVTLACSVDLRSASKMMFSNEHPLTSTYATKQGTVQLTPNSPGFSVQVDLENDYNEASDSRYGYYTVKMLLGLYTNETIFTQSCMDFNRFYCSSYSTCYSYSTTPSAVSLPYFVANGTKVSATAYVDYSHWSLSSLATLATSCQTNAYYYGGYSYGLIGLGTTSSQANFLSGKTFSIYLKEDETGGQLMFRSDMSYTSSSNYVAYLSADSNYHVRNVNYIQVGGYSTYISGTSLIFDLNTNAIGLPATIYTQVISYLTSHYSVTCYSSAGTDKPTCYYYGYISNLPTITITVSTYQTISLLPEVYVQNGRNSSYVSTITLNFRSLSPSNSGSGYVTSDYSNYIILGAPVMTYYYTVFDGSYQSISLYKASPPPTPVSGNLALILIIGGAVLFVILIGCCAFKARSKRNAAVVVTVPASTADMAGNVNTSDTVTVTAPLYVPPPQQSLYSGYQQPQPQGQAYGYGYGYPPAQGQQPVYGTMPNYGTGTYAAPGQQNNYN